VAGIVKGKVIVDSLARKVFKIESSIFNIGSSISNIDFSFQHWLQH